MWPKYVPLAMFAHNTFNTQNLGNYSQYELTYGRKPRPSLNLDSNSDIKVSGTFKEYYQLLRGLFKHERLKPANIKPSQGNVQHLISIKTDYECRF